MRGTDGQGERRSGARDSGSLLDHARELISETWPHRNDYFGVRLTLRSIVRHAKQLRDEAKPRHEWDDVRWMEADGEYEAACWCGWTDTAWAYEAAEEALRTHLAANGVVVA